MKFPRFIEMILAKRNVQFWMTHSIFWLIIIIESWIINAENIPNLEVFFKNVFFINFVGFLLTSLLRFFYKKFSVYKFKLLPLTLIVLLFSSFTALIWTYFFLIPTFFMDSQPNLVPLFVITHLFEINVISVLLWSSLYIGYKIWEEWNNQKFELEKERALLKSSQLELLKYQLNPHFLFNTLSSLRGLISVEPIKAKEMVTQISEFLRYSLLEGKNNEVNLISEIEIIKQYLNIEKTRFDEDLLVEFDISPATEEFMIPIFLIHPLVENAVKHGMQTSPLPLNISISSKITANNLVIEVKNSGKWVENNSKNNSISTGIGLRNIQKRLEHHFPSKHSFEIQKESDFVLARITINFNGIK